MCVLAQFSTQPVVVGYDSHQCNEGNRSKCVVAEKMPECPRANREGGSSDDQKEAIFHTWRFSAAEVLRHSRRVTIVEGGCTLYRTVCARDVLMVEASQSLLDFAISSVKSGCRPGFHIDVKKANRKAGFLQYTNIF